MYDVICVGSATVDVFAKTEFSETLRDRKKTQCITYPIGSKILINDLLVSAGGGGTNTPVPLARLGHKTAFLGKTGVNENHHRVILEMEKDNVDTSLIVSNPKARTGYSLILDSIKHDRTILTFRGSNNDLRYNEINFKKLKAKWFIFTSQQGESFRTQERLAAYAKRKGIKIAFILSEYLAKKGAGGLRKILGNTEIIVMNREEAEIFLNNKGTILENLKKLNALGPKIAIITDGSRGPHVLSQGAYYHSKPRNVKVVETTGAGDAFAASFLSGMIKKGEIEFAIKLGIVNAESVIRYHGAKNILLSYREALKHMKRSGIRLIKEDA